jgi:hypothetical protein
VKWLNFEMKQLSDIGTNNPIVARLSIQTNDLIKLFPLTEKQKEDIYGVLGMEVCQRLITCFKIYSNLRDELLRINQIDKSKIFKSNVIHTPSVLDLNNMCENFLYQAKSTLRDLLGIFKIFYNKEFAEAHYNKVYEWAKKKFGEEDTLANVLKDDHETWIKRIISMRNAVEHPRGYSGVLNINNIKLINTNEPPYFNAPTWHLNDEKESPILADMATFIDNTLGLCEDILVVLLEKLPKRDLPLVIVEIPEEERNADCPVRLKVSIHPEFAKQLKT